MNLKSYLERIGYHGSANPDLEVLKAIQKTHLLAVPFENLDIHYSREIRLDLGRIYTKIVHKKRGGFCYELNGLYHLLLNELGFKVKRISCKTFDSMGNLGEEFDHLANIVEIDGIEYLTDIGYGEFALGPLRLQLNKMQEDERGIFQVKMYEAEYIQVDKWIDGNSTSQYMFKNISRELDEFEEMCYYHQSDPKSHFTQKPMITKPTREGRITLTSDKLITTKKDSIQEIDVKDQTDFEGLLWKHFKIRMT